mmetsp:Transcript_35718/g.85966  ORF Transcript_35718/g.85966 Transcript_35718/m.85966 type:complete len:87 (-) Transcript_35718:54-314(-)
MTSANSEQASFRRFIVALFMSVMMLVFVGIASAWSVMEEEELPCADCDKDLSWCTIGMHHHVLFVTLTVLAGGAPQLPAVKIIRAL